MVSNWLQCLLEEGILCKADKLLCHICIDFIMSKRVREWWWTAKAWLKRWAWWWEVRRRKRCADIRRRRKNPWHQIIVKDLFEERWARMQCRNKGLGGKGCLVLFFGKAYEELIVMAVAGEKQEESLWLWQPEEERSERKLVAAVARGEEGACCYCSLWRGGGEKEWGSLLMWWLEEQGRLLLIVLNVANFFLKFWSKFWIF